MLRKKRERCGAPAKVTAILLVLMMLIALIAVGVVPVAVDAASAALGGSETINIYLQDSSWQGSNIRVRFLNSSNTQLDSVVKTPSGNNISVTGVSGAAKLTLEKLNAEKSTNLTAMQSVISSAGATQTVVFYDNASTQWTDMKYYAWTKQGTATYEDQPWVTRASMTKVSGTANIYSATINRNANLSSAYENIIFTGSDKQTADLTLYPSTASAVKVYNSAENKWITYTDVDRSLTVNVSERYGDTLNDLYLTSKTTAKWSKYNSSSQKTTVYFKPNSSSWTTAWVHYDDSDDEPFYTSVQMTQYSANPLIYKADVYFGAMVSFSTGADFDSSAKKDQGSVFEDLKEPVYVAKNRSWTTLDHAMAADDRYADFTVSQNNFASVTPTGGGKVVGFDATYYDYYSNNERSGGWRYNLNDDNFTDAYRKQFSDLNDEIISKAKSDAKWRYPLVFGDDTNATWFINDYYNQISGTRSPSITQANFRAANNSSFLGGESYRNRSIMGLVKNKLVGGDLMVTDTTKAPYFDNDWLANDTAGTTEMKEVLYIIDDANYGQNGIYANFWGGGSVLKDIHPEKVTDSAVTISGATGKIYRYVVDTKYTSVQLANSTNYGSHFYEYQENGQWVLSLESQVVRTGANQYTIPSSNYHSGNQNITVTSPKRATVIDSKFPFVETVNATTGVKSYVFDSKDRKDNIAFNFNNNNLNNSTLNYYSGDGVTGKMDGNNGFFPFNSTSNTYPRNYGFGMRVDIDFTLPKNGLFEDGTPAEFHYSGDDDVWVFIDGNLILDIGGAHTPTEGSINFGAGVGTITATSDTVYRQLSQTEKTTQVFEFVFDKPSSEPSGYLAKWNGGQYPASGQTSWSSLSGKAFFTSGNVRYLSDDFKSYDDASGKRHIFVVNDSNKNNVAIYSTDNSFGNWNDCIPSNSSYQSKVDIFARSHTETISMTDIDKNGDSVTKTFSFNNTDPTKKHQMTVFYMERGTNDSNLKIEFTIQPVLNELDVYKEVQFEDLNTGLDDEVMALTKDSDFGFTFKQNGSGYGGSNGKKFNYVHADDTTTTDTIKNGAFSLKHYEEAMFNNDTTLTYNSVISLQESKPSLFSYDTEIEVKDILNGTELPVVNDDHTTFTFRNSLNDPEERTLMIAEFINTLKTASITLNKELYQNGSDTPSTHLMPFEFTIELDINGDGDFESYDLEYRFEGDDTIYIAENGVVQMRPDQIIEFFGIPVGTPYQITETPLAGFSIRANECQDISGDVEEEGSSAVFVNEEAPAQQTVSVTKTLDGNRYSGNEFAFNIKLIKWDYGETRVYTDEATLEPIYPENTCTSVTNGLIAFDPFDIVPTTDNVGLYTFKITETDKSATQPWYSYDSTIYYALIRVDAGTMDAPVFYSDADCTVPITGTPNFVNTTRRGTITVAKNDVDDQPISGTRFALLKVSSQADVDSHLTPAVINALIESSIDAGDSKVQLETTGTNGKAVFDDLDLYQDTGQFVYNSTSGQIEWSTSVTATAKQTYCVFEYSPTDGYLPNYTKAYVVLADETNCSRTFGYVDGRVVMPNSSGGGSAFYQWLGLGIIAFAALLFGAYMLMRKRKKPVHAARFIQ